LPPPGRVPRGSALSSFRLTCCTVELGSEPCILCRLGVDWGSSEDRMAVDTWLRIGAIGLPLAGALAIWRGGPRFPRAQRQVAIVILATTALIALTLFLLNRQYACILAFARQSCLFEGLGTLSLFLLGIVLARSCFVLRGGNKEQGYALLLLVGGTWAGMGLAQNVCLFLVCLNLFIFAMDRWLKRKGISWRFMALRDDYKDDE
jgi:hypothetical protein